MFEKKFKTLGGAKGKRYWDKKTHTEVSVGVNPKLRSPTKHFVHIRHFKGYKAPTQKWFKTEKEALTYAHKYTKKH
jgi:hypothetical protein